MILRNCKPCEFPARISGKTLVCFGAGNVSVELHEKFPEMELAENIAYFADNSPEKWNTVKNIGGRQTPVYSPEYLYTNADADTIILISNWDSFYEIYEQLEKITALQSLDCYIGPFFSLFHTDALTYGVPLAPRGFRANAEKKIPKVIHYCWFGKNPIPEQNKRCIDSWRRYCPDYEIVEWNESNYDVTKSKYMYEAYNAKKWGFVPDYARLDIIYEQGGIYLDADVEVIKSLDELLYNDFYCAFESPEFVNLGSGFGASARHPVIGEMRDYYNELTFVREDGELDLTASPVIQTQIMEAHGLKRDGTFQILDGMTVYPAVYLCPKSLFTRRMFAAEDAFSIHHYDGSWRSEATLSHMDKRQKLISLLVDAYEKRSNPAKD